MEYEDKEKLAKFITEDYPEIRMLINAGHYEEMWEYILSMEKAENKANVFRLLCALDELKINHGLTQIPDNAFNLNGGSWWTRAGGLPSKLVIPSCITDIGEQAFAFLMDVKEVVLPDSIRVEPNGLNRACFYGGDYSKITFPSNMKYVPALCCGRCQNLKTVKLPNSTEIIGESAFEDCHSLHTIKLPPNLKKINERAFADSGLTKIEIPASVEKIGRGAFSRCSDIKSITLPKKFDRGNSQSLMYMGFYKDQVQNINWV